MAGSSDHPRFGEATLSNCERELIHLPGSIQPHGVLLVLDASDGTVRQATTNAAELLGLEAESLLGRDLRCLGGTLFTVLDGWISNRVPRAPLPFPGTIEVDGLVVHLDAALHRNAQGALILELEPARGGEGAGPEPGLAHRLAESTFEIARAGSLPALHEAIVEAFRSVAGYDRVMVYRFDPEGHGEVVAEGREPHLEPFLGLNYPASDIPQRARELYLRNKVRVLADVDAVAAPLLPRLHPDSGEDLDMSMAGLRSMSPLHLQYLRNMGVTATLVASLMRGGQLWGLVSCHHYSPRTLPWTVRAACEVLAEVAGARIASLERVEIVAAEATVRRFESRLVANVAGGAWRAALFNDPRELLGLVDASGAFLSHDGEMLVAGQVPSNADLRALRHWLSLQEAAFDQGVFASSVVAREHPELAHLGESACGVLAVEISRDEREYLVWLRGERVREVRWAGNPRKPVVVGNDPRDLSPRRSFAVWVEQVRGTSRPWSRSEVALARSLGSSLRDAALQVGARNLLLLEDRLVRARRAVRSAKEGVLVASADHRVLFVNEAFAALVGCGRNALSDLDDLPRLFHDPVRARDMLTSLRNEGRNWSGELRPQRNTSIALGVEADLVVRPDGSGVLGYILLLRDISARDQARVLRDRIHRAVKSATDVPSDPLAAPREPRREGLERPKPVPVRAAGAAPARPVMRSDSGTPEAEYEALMDMILSSSSGALLDLLDEAQDPDLPGSVRQMERSAQRAGDLIRQMIAYARERRSST